MLIGSCKLVGFGLVLIWSTCCKLSDSELLRFGINSASLFEIRLGGAGLFCRLDEQLLLMEMDRLLGLLDNMSVSIELLLIRLLLSRRRLLWLLALLLGYSESLMMFDDLVRGVVEGMTNKLLMFFTLFPK